MARQRTYALLSLLLLVVFALWTIRAMQPPAPLPAGAPPTEFSAQRAFRHVEQTAREPHAMGTAEHARVRAYLLAQMRQLGLNPQVQETTVAHRRSNRVGYVFNLLGRLSGQNPTGSGDKAVLMLAHYDSQPNALGAADDLSSVAAILETARALRAGPPLQNDVIFLLTDGEEYGLFGATAFLRHPWAKDVGFVMNLEARGVRGPSMTFEISPENGWAVEAFGRAAPYPLASSLMYEVYRSLPNSTDFTIFRNAGYTGLNSAYIDGFVHYHKLTDSPSTLNLGTLQHHGSNLLALTRYVGNQPLGQTKAHDKVFFNTVGFHFVQYPMGLNGWLFALLTLGVLGTWALGVRNGLMPIGQSFAGAGLFGLSLLLIVGAFWPITVAVRQVLPPALFVRQGLDGQPLPFSYYINGIYGSDRFLVAYALLAVGLFGLLTWLALRWVRPFALVMGTYLMLYGLVALTFVKLPAATYLLLFPLLFAVAGTAILVRRHVTIGAQRGPLRTAWLPALAAALPALLLMPLVRLLFVTFDLQMPFIASMVLFGLMLGLLLPLMLLIDAPLRWRGWPTVPLGALLLGLGVTVWAIQAEKPSAEQPLHSMISYYMDVDSSKAYWVSGSQALDSWKQQFFTKPTVGTFTEFYPASWRIQLKNAAPLLPLPAPTATVLSDSGTATGRTLRLQLHSPRGGSGFEIGVIAPDTADVRALRVNDEPVRLAQNAVPGGHQFFIECYGLPLSKTITLTVEARPRVPLQLLLYDESLTLPAPLIRVPRPADVVYEQGKGSNQTVVRKAFRF